MSAFLYPSAPHSRRHGPCGYADVDSYRFWLRDEFTFRCVYCLFREQWGRLKAGFALDHFLLVALHPEQERIYDNLLYACVACNQTKGATILPDPTQVLLDGTVRIHADGPIEGRTREARRIIRVLGLDDRMEKETRLLWLGIIALAEHFDPTLYRRLMGFPDHLPNLVRLRPPEGNLRPEGVNMSYFVRREHGTLPTVY
jgi:hypothetical protein